MSEERGVHELRLGLYASREEAERIKERVTALLCPDPDHAPPCPVPWSVLLLSGDDLDDPDAYEELVEQARIENRPQA
ncbi:hypothetical protein ABZ023_21275 [Streptomyces sp. NPDC006367]|uniref:hypothetical protein n=1 Tax=unclassified Streptomyces TaxID=2593676 RepID=UPI0033B96AD8